MKPALLVAGGVLCLAGALAIELARGDARERDRPVALEAAKTLGVDALFLRGEALRTQGRADELIGLYQRILDLDPGNEAAIDFLSDVEAKDLRTLAPDEKGRVRWWRAGWDLISGALRANPRSGRLHFRAADLLLNVAGLDPAVSAALASEGRDRELEGLRHLAEAARIDGYLKHWGYAHLDRLAHAAPRIAAQRLATGEPGADEALSIAEEALVTRRADLEDFVLDPVPPFATAFDRLLASTLLVKAVRGRMEASPPEGDAARDLLSHYDSLSGPDSVSEVLSRWVEARAPRRK